MKTKTALMLAGTSAVLLAGAYYLLLSDDAKRSVRESVEEVRHAAREVGRVVDGNGDTEGLPNRRRTEEMWRALGY